MNPSKRPAALLIDLDGVLVDTETPALAALATTFADYGAAITTDEVIRRFRGKNLDRCTDEVTEVLAEPLPPEFIAEARRRAQARPAPQAEPGAAELLAAPVARRIVTNSRLSHSLDTLRSAGLDQAARRDEIVSVDRVRRAKPAPDLYLAALADLGLAAGDCLAIEDSVTGLRAARAAGVPAVGYAADDQHRWELVRAGFPAISLLAELWEGTP